MPKIKLNEEGKELYSYLSDTWLEVYGYNPELNAFVIWDNIMCQWEFIETYYCEGRGDEAVE